MVSNASEDLPDPESPVMTTSASRGSVTVTSLRLCSRAPETTICECRAIAHLSLESRTDVRLVSARQLRDRLAPGVQRRLPDHRAVGVEARQTGVAEGVRGGSEARRDPRVPV